MTTQNWLRFYVRRLCIGDVLHLPHGYSVAREIDMREYYIVRRCGVVLLVLYVTGKGTSRRRLENTQARLDALQAQLVLWLAAEGVSCDDAYVETPEPAEQQELFECYTE